MKSVDVAQIVHLAPLLVLAAMACVMLVAETFIQHSHAGLPQHSHAGLPQRSRAGLMGLGLGGCAVALGLLVAQWPDAAASQTVLGDMWIVDRTAIFLDVVFIIAAALTLLLSHAYLREHEFEFGEFYALVLLAVTGMVMLVHAGHLLMLLIGIETMSIAAYVLTGCWRKNARSSEGAMKYFLMGAFATSFLVYGMALVYGTTGGELAFAKIAEKAGVAAKNPLFVMGVFFVVVAMIFKVAAVPFHMWAPDAYEGAPTPVTGFMAAGVKAAAFGGLVRLLGSVFGDPALALGGGGWVRLLSIVAFLTMTLGNLAALRQENVKRMLAYSSIAHAGYLLVGVAAMGLGTTQAMPAVLFYLVAYTFTTLGTFGVVAWMGRRGDERLFIDDWAGAATARPALALAMTLFLLSLGGVPPTGGFFGKLYLFRSAMENPELYWLVVAAMLNSVVSVYYYLRVVVAMYFRDPVRPHEAFPSQSMQFAIAIAALAVVALGVFPGMVVDWAASAAPAAAAAAKVAGL
jgi:NADH-quinone oxidoreductase subunit N